MILVLTNVIQRDGVGTLEFLRLYDGSGSIKMVLTKDIASRVLHRNLSELILIASQNRPLAQNLQQPFSVKIRIPESIEIIEPVTENTSSSYRSNGELIVTDGINLDLAQGLIELLVENNFTLTSLLNASSSELSKTLGIDQEVAH